MALRLPRGATISRTGAAEQAHADPYELPRQRHGVDAADARPLSRLRRPRSRPDHWDEVTRTRRPRARRTTCRRSASSTEARRRRSKAFCDVVLRRRTREPRIPVLAYVDEKLYAGERDGYRYFDMPDDRRDAGGSSPRGLDEEARGAGARARSRRAARACRSSIVDRFAKATLHGGVWDTAQRRARLDASSCATCSQAFYSHPWAWNEIGFGGPAYPRGYAALRQPAPRAARARAWEAREAFDTRSRARTRRAGARLSLPSAHQGLGRDAARTTTRPSCSTCTSAGCRTSTGWRATATATTVDLRRRRRGRRRRHARAAARARRAGAS